MKQTKVKDTGTVEYLMPDEERNIHACIANIAENYIKHYNHAIPHSIAHSSCS